uniref:Uncharacterized protein n=1 Tax=Biomphalaria glabrata TaxID=6526 RepID=A0A2C9KLS2_BIOGL
RFPSSARLCQARDMAAHTGQYSDSPWSTLRPPYSPTLINLNQNYNMTANSLTETLLILTSMYLGVVQPEAELVNVSLHTVIGETFTFSSLKESSELIFDKPGTPSKGQPVLNAMTVKHMLQRNDDTPRAVLNLLCSGFFPKTPSPSSSSTTCTAGQSLRTVT